MKKIYKNNILNIEGTNLFDNKLEFSYLIPDFNNNEIETIYISDLLENKKNNEILLKVKNKPGMYSNVYSPEDELAIFKKIFNDAIKNNKKTHIIGITLNEEVKIIEEYYESLGFMREDINCFKPDFSIPLVTISVKIENLIWKGSDYKSQKSNIFFKPPIRESGQTKSMFKGINRGVIAGIYISNFNKEIENFLGKCIIEEKILALTLGEVLNFNLLDIGFSGETKKLVINY